MLSFIVDASHLSFLHTINEVTIAAYLCVFFFLFFFSFFFFASCHEDWYSYKTLPEVSVRCIRERHLVSCTAESLLPLVLANCNYSLTVGQTTSLEYDYETFEKQLKGSVLECKYRIARHKDRYFEVCLFTCF